MTTLQLLDTPPLPDDDRSCDGYLLNVYVVPDRRRRGIGRRLLTACLDGAAQRRVRRVGLRATDDGRSLYESVGFAPEPAWMSRAVGRGG